jgi:hypothetical protein
VNPGEVNGALASVVSTLDNEILIQICYISQEVLLWWTTMAIPRALTTIALLRHKSL